MYLSRACAEYRNKYPIMRTQMRFGDKDVEIHMKEKGTAEPLKISQL